MISARGVSIQRGKRQILDSVDLSLSQGEALAVLGPSGSGKSTLLHCLSGLLRPDGGQVSAGSVVVSQLSESRRAAWRLRHAGFVFQSGELLPELSLRENIELPLRLLGAPSADRRTRTGELLGWLDLTRVADQMPSTCSGGEIQRAAVARALVHRPDIVFADEPTGALDRANGEMVVAALLELARSQGTTVLVITHDVNLASSFPARIFLRDGIVCPSDSAEGVRG